MKTILIVDDNKMNLATARSVLSSEYRVIPVMKGTQALTYLEKGECDIVLLDINMPEMDGFEVLEKMRGMDQCCNIPVIFLTADNDVETETRCFNEGAVDFIAKPFIPEVMLSRIGRALELEELRRSLAYRLEQKTQEFSVIRDRAQRDALTGLWDRTYTEEAVSGMLEQGATGSFMMIDIDNFKSVNDNYGHIAGDKVLKMLADTLRDFSAEGDVLCRIGGDEFVVFMKDVIAKDKVRNRAENITSRLRDKIVSYGFIIDTSISIGIAQAPEDGKEFTNLYNSADKALYYVKRNGKNSYHFFSDKFPDENEHNKDAIDLKDLQDRTGRTDNGNGAYLLNIESFLYVYNFVGCFIERCGHDVTMLLFTLGEANTKAMELLENTICAYLRRSDVTTRYSNRQLVVILMDANNENGGLIAEQILGNFTKTYPEETIHIDYSIARIDNRLTRKTPGTQDEN